MLLVVAHKPPKTKTHTHTHLTTKNTFYDHNRRAAQGQSLRAKPVDEELSGNADEHVKADAEEDNHVN